MFIHCLSPPLGRFRKQNWQDLVTDDKFCQHQACRSPGREVSRKQRGVVNMGGGKPVFIGGGKPVLSLRKSDKFEGHWVTGRTSHNTDSQWPHAGLGVREFWTWGWPIGHLRLGASLRPEPSPSPLHSWLYASPWWIIMFFFLFISLHSAHPSTSAQWILNLFMQVLGSLWRKSRSLYFWSSRKEETKNHSAERHSLDSI